MSTGQIFLTLASLILLGYITLNIKNMYVSSVELTTDTQMTSDAINFGRDLSEEIQSYAFKYDSLNAHFGNLDDVTDPGRRRSDTTQVGRIFHATINLSSEIVLEHGESGRLATIKIYEEVDHSLEKKAIFITAVTDLE